MTSAATATTADQAAALTKDERAILDIARKTWRKAGNQAKAISDLGLSPTVFASRLNRLLDTKRAMAAYPVDVKRLRELRATVRSARRYLA